MMRDINISEFIGCTFDKIDGSFGTSEQISFFQDGEERFRMFHSQDCCEMVEVEDICGDVADLIGVPIIEAEEVSKREPKVFEDGYSDESGTWTFYKLGTIKGFVTIRWYGSSNGWYSESVDIVDLQQEGLV